MTDEEMAEEFAEKRRFKSIDDNSDIVMSQNKWLETLKQAFLAGLKAGRPEWHDLRENRNDIPPLDKDCERTSIKVVDDYGRVITYDYGSERWRDYEGDSLGLQPDFWCEIPTFTDKE